MSKTVALEVESLEDSVGVKKTATDIMAAIFVTAGGILLSIIVILCGALLSIIALAEVFIKYFLLGVVATLIVQYFIN